MSINWGPWAEVGMSAPLDDLLQGKWADEGIQLFTPVRGARALATLPDRPLAQVVAGQCDWDVFVARRPLDNALYHRVVQGRAGSGETFDLTAALALAENERMFAGGDFVRASVAAVLHLDDVDLVDPHTEFVKLGLDSLVSVELKNRLENGLRIPLAVSVLFDHLTADALTLFLDGQLAIDTAH